MAPPLPMGGGGGYMGASRRMGPAMDMGKKRESVQIHGCMGEGSVNQFIAMDVWVRGV